MAADLRVGTKLAAYELQEIVARGGMGVVYRAQHVHLRRPAAVKLLLPEIAQDDDFRRRFLRESQIAASLQHPNVVTVYDAGEADGLLYIAMQYIEGTDLATLLEEEGSLESGRALSIVGQVAAALDAAHALGLVHRDVKPANVLLDGDHAFLTDFGLSKPASSQTNLTAKGQFVGTIAYMAPEQIKGAAVDPRTDVYALGCVLYHCLAGGVPYARDSDVAVIFAHMEERPELLSSPGSGLPQALDAVIAKALAKRAEDRYETCTRLVEAARNALGGKAPSGAAVGVAARRKVMVADSDPSIRAMIRVSLGQDGYEVLDAASADDALELARSEGPDLLFVDWSFSGGAGAELCKSLRAEPATAGSRIIALSGRDDAVDRDTARAAGADDWIRKPFSSVQVLQKIAPFLDSS
ncbi:MAG: serine/threonine-protein kinase [Actinomycetota bacterium]|nr:serine/threonine-protein kinase [Actinomycetota bacterium]